MSISGAINLIFFIFAILGAVDYLLDNRLGLGSQFERGICCAGKLIIAMTGFMALSSVLGRALTPIVSPVFAAMGADPSALAGMLLANDSGGAALAAEMAADAMAGDFNGYFIASMLGASVMCIIPMTMLSANRDARSPAICGLVIGLASIPPGAAAGGIAAGYPLKVVLMNLIPASLLCFALFFTLLLLSRWIIRPFQMFGKLLVGVSLTGLLLITGKELLGFAPIDGLNPFSDIICVIGGIALVLSGVFPLLTMVSKLLKKPLSRAARQLAITEQDISGLLVTAVNVFPTFELLNAMSPKGILVNCAFMAGANCMLGDHFAFTSQTRPELAIPVLIGKAVSGFLALFMALLLSQRLLGRPLPAGEKAADLQTDLT